MLPTATKTILDPLTVDSAAQQPSRTYRVDWEAGRIARMTDGREAMIQAIRKILDTSRFAYLIYSWNYGTEWNGLLGADRSVAESEIKRILWEALRQDTRITALTRVAITRFGRKRCRVSMEVETIFGTVREETIVDV